MTENHGPNAAIYAAYLKGRGAERDLLASVLHLACDACSAALDAPDAPDTRDLLARARTKLIGAMRKPRTKRINRRLGRGGET